ncbi:MAG: DUF3842 family protein [Clostridia bacterium]|nr:DUF3842 family protein [Clostridia bacterium]
MKLVVIDGQGGGIGKSIVEAVRRENPNWEVIAVGTNVAATTAMLRAGAHAGATGENAVVFNCADADVVAGPIGIVFANAMFGEISPTIAAAVSGCRAQKLLIPVKRCVGAVMGVADKPLSAYFDELCAALRECEKHCEARPTLL